MSKGEKQILCHTSCCGCKFITQALNFSRQKWTFYDYNEKEFTTKFLKDDFIMNILPMRPYFKLSIFTNLHVDFSFHYLVNFKSKPSYMLRIIYGGSYFLEALSGSFGLHFSQLFTRESTFLCKCTPSVMQLRLLRWVECI